MLTPMLTGNLIIFLRMFVSKLAVKLTMLPRTQPLLVCFGMLFVEPIMNIRRLLCGVGLRSPYRFLARLVGAS